MMQTASDNALRERLVAATAAFMVGREDCACEALAFAPNGQAYTTMRVQLPVSVGSALSDAEKTIYLWVAA